MIKNISGYCDLIKSECTIEVEYEYSPTLDRKNAYVKKLPISSCPINCTECQLYQRQPLNIR